MYDIYVYGRPDKSDNCLPCLESKLYIICWCFRFSWRYLCNWKIIRHYLFPSALTPHLNSAQSFWKLFLWSSTSSLSHHHYHTNIITIIIITTIFIITIAIITIIIITLIIITRKTADRPVKMYSFRCNKYPCFIRKYTISYHYHIIIVITIIITITS